MANQNIKLEKSIISQGRSNQIYQKNFSKLGKSTDPVDDEKIVEKYDELFYEIKKEGKESHKSIIEESYNYIYDHINKLWQSRIDKLLESLAGFQKILSDLLNPGSKEHPIYEDGSFLIAGQNGEKYQDMHTVYIMQEGRKRVIGSSENNTLYFTIRRCLGLPENFLGKYFVTIDELVKIPSGKAINTTADLHISGDDLIDDSITEPFGIAAYYDVRFWCNGNEIQDSLNLVLGDDTAAIAQYYLDNQPCIIRYLVDDYSNDETGPRVEEVILEKGEEVELRLLREIYLEDEEGFGINNLPNNIGTFYNDNWNSESEIFYNGNNISNYQKLWGEGNRYASVVFASGRIKSKETYSIQISNQFFQQDTTERIFNGLPTEGSNYFQVVDQPNDLGNEYFGSLKRIYAPGIGYYGSLNQTNSFQSNFDNRDYGYYRSTIRENNGINITQFIKDALPGWASKFIPDMWIFRSKELPIYGQPIIKHNSNHYVVCGLKSSGISFSVFGKDYRWAVEFVVFYNLGTKELFARNKGKADNYGVYLRMSSGKIQGIDWSRFAANKISFIGLKGVKVVGAGNSGEGQGNDNPWNPKTGGSNYELNSTNTP